MGKYLKKAVVGAGAASIATAVAGLAGSFIDTSKGAYKLSADSSPYLEEALESFKHVSDKVPEAIMYAQVHVPGAINYASEAAQHALRIFLG